MSVIAHPTDPNLRIRTHRDDAPAKPYDDGGFPIWRLVYAAGGGLHRVEHESDLTSYVTPVELDMGIAGIVAEHGHDDILTRYLRIFWGATFTGTWHSGSYWYVTADPAHWREEVGVTDEITQREDYTDGAFTEFEAWVEGNVHYAVEEQRVQREVKTRTIYPGGDTDDEFRTFEDWEDTDTGAVGGFYGDVDQDMATTMAWNFGWDIPEGHTFEIEED